MFLINRILSTMTFPETPTIIDAGASDTTSTSNDGSFYNPTRDRKSVV